MTFETASDGSTRRIFVQLSNLNGFAVIDFAARKEVARIKLPDNGFGAAERRMDSLSHGLGVAPGGKTLWVTSIAANAVFAYSLPELELLGQAALPQLELAGRKPISAVPNWVTFTPDGKRLYVSNAAARSVSVIDTGALKLLATVPVGEVPKRINTRASLVRLRSARPLRERSPRRIVLRRELPAAGVIGAPARLGRERMQ